MRRIALALAVVLASAGAASATPSFNAARVDRQGGVVRLATGIDSLPSSGEPSDIARRFLAAHAADFGLSGVELAEPRVFATSLGNVVRFETALHGITIAGAEVTVGLDAQGRIHRVVSDSVSVEGAVLVKALEPKDAMVAAARDVDGILVEKGIPVGEGREIVYVESGVAHLAYQIHLRSLDPTVSLVAVVDASTGERRSLTNRAMKASPDAAKVWQANPGKDGTAVQATVALTNLPATRDPNGYLVGDFINAYSCCPNEGCDPTKGPLQITGTFKQGGFSVPFTADFCDMQHTASNTRNGRVNYDYGITTSKTQADPPAAAPGKDPADSDTFAEVHGYFHANQIYDYFRTLSPGFLLRDQKRTATKRLQLWTNFILPDYNSLALGAGGAVVKGFTRVDNSVYIPKEGWSQFTFGATTSYKFPDTDAILLFQGPKADFAYDGDVAYHEFTHGVIFATANFQGLQVDRYGALNEGGAMHEAIADFYAGAFTNDAKIGDYVGPRIDTGTGVPAEGALRDLENTFKCPELLVGEVHNDSQHFSAALWAARKKNQGADKGVTFDKAVFNALVSATPATGFKGMATLIADSVQAAFPADTSVKAGVLAEFTSRGVIDCVKVVDYATPRPFYVVEGKSQGVGPFVPGPVQLRLKLPKGASSITVTATLNSSGPQPPGGGPAVLMKALASLNKPVTFTGTTALTHDAQFSQGMTVSGTTLKAELPLFADCNASVYVTLANEGSAAVTALDVTVTAKVLAACAGPDAGPPGPDAAEAGPDAAEPVADAGTGTVATSSCGCSAVDAGPLMMMALAGLVLRRRKQ